MEGPHQVELTGALSDVTFPNRCAACGEAPPAGDVAIEKMFRRTYHERPSTYVFAHLRAPLCRDCLAAHARDRRPPDPAVLRALRRRWALKILPYLLPMGVQIFFIAQFGPKAVATLPGLFRSPPVWDALIWLAVTALFALLLAMFVTMSVRAGRPLIADGLGDPNDTYVETTSGPLGSLYVVPVAPTPTLAAVNFGDERIELFAPNHRTFAFASPLVASEFAALNAARRWDPSSPRAKRARRAEFVVIGLVVAGAVVAMIVDFVRG